MTGEVTAPLLPLYGKLDTSQKEIRLLELECCEDDNSGPVRCTLVKSTIEGNLPYEALSYVWGDSANPIPVSINGHTLHITRNLDTTLRHLRRRSSYRDATDAGSDTPAANLPIGTRRIWVDALCINQNDVQERGEQVKLMFDLYSHAARVLIWLGEAQDESDLAMDLIYQLQASQLELIQKQYPQLAVTRWEQGQLAKWSAQAPWYYSLLKLHGSSGGEHLNPQDPREWVAFQRLMDRPWWQRV